MKSMLTKLPLPIKTRLKAAQLALIDGRQRLQFLQIVLLARLGIKSDFVGYENLIKYIDANKIYELRGDFLEIGAFMGGGSAKLAKYGDKYHKYLIVIDVFDPEFDNTQNILGQPLNVLYRRLLGPGDQKNNLQPQYKAST